MLDLKEHYNRNLQRPLPVTSSEERLMELTRSGGFNRRAVTSLYGHNYKPLSDNENLQ